MTNKVKVPVFAIDEAATWLRDNPNDFKTWVEGEVAAVLPTLVSGRLLTNNGSVASWATFVSFFPALQNGKFLKANGGNLSWDLPREVPDPTGVPIGHVVTRTSSSPFYNWEPSAGGNTYQVVDEQTFLVGDRGTHMCRWEKPVGTLPTDFVVVTMVGGGGSGGVTRCYYHTSYSQLAFATGGFGGAYGEWVFRASQVDSEMLAIPGEGAPGVYYTSGGFNLIRVNGYKGGDSAFSSIWQSKDIENITYNPINNQVTIHITAHGFGNGNVVVLRDIDSLNDFQGLNGIACVVSDVSADSFKLKHISTGDYLVGVGSFSPIAGSVAGISTWKLWAGGGEGGVTAIDDASQVLPPEASSSRFNGIPIVDRLTDGGTGSNLTANPVYGLNGSSAPNSPSLFGGAMGKCTASAYLYNAAYVVAGTLQGARFGGAGGDVTQTNAYWLTGDAGDFPGGGGGSTAFTGFGPNFGSPAGTIAIPLTSGAGAPGYVTVRVIRTPFISHKWNSLERLV